MPLFDPAAQPGPDGARGDSGRAGAQGAGAAEAMEAARYEKNEDGTPNKGKIVEYISVDDLQERSGASKTLIEALQELGALDCLPKTTQISFF